MIPVTKPPMAGMRGVGTPFCSMRWNRSAVTCSSGDGVSPRRHAGMTVSLETGIQLLGQGGCMPAGHVTKTAQGEAHDASLSNPTCSFFFYYLSLLAAVVQTLAVGNMSEHSQDSWSAVRHPDTSASRDNDCRSTICNTAAAEYGRASTSHGTSADNPVRPCLIHQQPASELRGTSCEFQNIHVCQICPQPNALEDSHFPIPQTGHSRL